MPDLSTIRGQVADRVKELEGLIAPLRAELEELTAVAERFTTSNGGAPVPAPAKRPRRRAAPKPAATGKPAAASRRSRRASGGGSRAEQAITLIGAQPGISVPEMAKTMGIGSNYLYRVLPQLAKDGKVRKEGKGYQPVQAPEQG
jgi:hypothetical protein